MNIWTRFRFTRLHKLWRATVFVFGFTCNISEGETFLAHMGSAWSPGLVIFYKKHPHDTSYSEWLCNVFSFSIHLVFSLCIVSLILLFFSISCLSCWTFLRRTSSSPTWASLSSPSSHMFSTLCSSLEPLYPLVKQIKSFLILQSG